MQIDVPVIDIAPFSTGPDSARRAVAQAVGDACETIGFLQITGHGVPAETIDRFYGVARRFFELPLAQKFEVKSPIDNRYHGYAAPGNGPGFQPSERQSYAICRFDTPEEAIAHGYPSDAGTTMLPAIWPREPEGFRETWRLYFDEMEVLARRLLEIFEVALGLAPRWFAPRVDLDQSTLAANYYSNEIDSGHEPSPYRFKAHVDGSLLTILYQDDGPGSLQLHQRGRGWGDVLPVEGTFVVNLGELMARWTNDRFVATPHRVLRPPPELESVPRLSAPFFFKPNHDAVVAPIPELLRDGEVAKYEPVSGRDFLARDQRDTLNGYDSTTRFEELAAVTPILQHNLEG